MPLGPQPGCQLAKLVAAFAHSCAIKLCKIMCSISSEVCVLFVCVCVCVLCVYIFHYVVVCCNPESRNKNTAQGIKFVLGFGFGFGCGFCLWHVALMMECLVFYLSSICLPALSSSSSASSSFVYCILFMQLLFLHAKFSNNLHCQAADKSKTNHKC